VIHIVFAQRGAYVGWTRRLSHSVARRSKRLSLRGPQARICLGSFLSFVVRRADGEDGEGLPGPLVATLKQQSRLGQQHFWIIARPTSDGGLIALAASRYSPAIRRASSLLSSLAAERRPGSSSKQTQASFCPVLSVTDGRFQRLCESNNGPRGSAVLNLGAISSRVLQREPSLPLQHTL
jgi:hypothetical protein